MVEAKLDAGQLGKVLLNAREELQVMAGDHDAQGTPESFGRLGERRRCGRERPIEQVAQALCRGLHPIRRDCLGDA